MTTKYIMFEDAEYIPSPVLFNDHMIHKEVAQRLGRTGPLMSAGFVDISIDPKDGRVIASAYGTSESLNLSARPEKDSEIITDMLRRTW